MAFRTDLAVEAIENHKTAAALPHVRQSDRTLEGFAVHEVRILSEDAAREIGKPQGRYLTLELDALIRREEDAFPRACKALSTLLRELLPHPNDGPVLIAGLGNRMITPDAIGPQTADHVIATRHLVAQSPAIFADWRPVSALAPGVLGQTGVETGEVIPAAGHSYKDGKCTVCGAADPNANSGGNTGNNGTDSPNTADEAAMGLWLSLMTVAALAGAVLVLGKRYRA